MTAATLSAPGDYLLRLAADDGEPWHSATVAVHRLPEGSVTARAWSFERNGDQDGWTDGELGTQLQIIDHPDWPTRAEPVHYVAGGYYLTALKESTAGWLLSPAHLNLPEAEVRAARLRLMNSTNATRLRLRLLTDSQRATVAAKSVDFAVVAHDQAPREYLVPLPALDGQIEQVRLELGTGQPVTGTVRLDYLWLGR